MISRALRGRILTFIADPAERGIEDACRYWRDGLIVVEAGRVRALGDASALLPGLPAGVAIDEYPDALILPGFIDPHIHYGQTGVIASYGAQLLEWLETYTFPAEAKLADPAHAALVADFFLDELLRNGTTTAAVYATVHPQSVDAFFAASEARGTSMIAGKVLMDRNAPEYLTDTAKTGHDESLALIARWHGRGRQRYAVTPRFAITSTEAQLESAGALAKSRPDLYIQTHMSENRDEIAWVRALFPGARDYADVYDRFGLLGPRTLLGHCIHVSSDERRRLAETGSVAVFCPTSNLFIGSGLFDLATMRATPAVRVALATDVGGGTSYSMLRTAGEAYKVLQLQGQNLTAFAAFHQMTRGNAVALSMESEIGALTAGSWADAVVLDARATPAMAHRMDAIRPDASPLDRLAAELFILMTLGDDRSVQATYVAGSRLHAR